MNASEYLKSYGWKHGEALRQGGLKKPILVKHKKDTKGLGHDANDADLWWEKLFDGHLKNLEVNSGSKGEVSFQLNTQKVVSDVKKATSPLYRMFVRGEGLLGTVGKTEHVKEKHIEIDAKKAMEDIDQEWNKEKKEMEKKEKTEKKERKEKKKERKEKKEKKKEKKAKKESTSKDKLKDKSDKIKKPDSKKLEKSKSKKQESKAKKLSEQNLLLSTLVVKSETTIIETKPKSKSKDKKEKKSKTSKKESKISKKESKSSRKETEKTKNAINKVLKSSPS